MTINSLARPPEICKLNLNEAFIQAEEVPVRGDDTDYDDKILWDDDDVFDDDDEWDDDDELDDDDLYNDDLMDVIDTERRRTIHGGQFFTITYQ